MNVLVNNRTRGIIKPLFGGLKMAKARVELREGISYTLRGRVYRKGQPQLLTDADEIHQAKLTGSLMVTMLDEAPPKKPSAPKAAPPKAAPKEPVKEPEQEPKQESAKEPEQEPVKEPEQESEPAPKAPPKGKKKPLKRKKS